MSHDINVVDGVASMAYNAVNGMPWHGLGQSVQGAMTSEEALKLAHLDYNVAKIPLFGNYQAKDSKDTDILEVTKALKKVAVIREDTKDVLGIVGSKYHPVQNIDSFKFFDNIVSAQEAMYETAGALGQGQKVWIMVKLPEDIIVNGDDVTKCYLLLYNSHDGSSAVRVRFTPVRVVCQNTLTMALQGKCKEVCIRHTKNADKALATAHELLGIVKNEIKTASEIFQIFTEKRVDTAELKAYLEQLYPINDEEDASNTRRDNICNEIEMKFKSGLGNKGQTVWDLYNGTIEYIDHSRVVKNNVNRWENTTFGPGLGLKEKAFELALALTK